MTEIYNVSHSLIKAINTKKKNKQKKNIYKRKKKGYIMNVKMTKKR